jgi:hypothetical protein
MIRRLRFIVVFIALGVLLTACATTIQSDVIAFHQWPADLPVRTFAFSRTPEQDASLEYRTYEVMVRNALSRLGYIPDTEQHGAALIVTISYDVRGEHVVITEPYDPFYYGAGFYPGWGWQYGGPSPYFDPFYGPPMRQSIYPIYTRHLHIAITGASGKKALYEVDVVSEGGRPGLAFAMPYMIRSAFLDFPGQSGVMRRVRLKMD